LAAEGVKGAAYPVPSAVPLVLLLLLFFLFVVLCVQGHALVFLFVLVLVRSNATPLVLARGAPLSSLIPVSAHVALCVHVDVC
jgi:ABC-type transport system involved in multi-copper enzyme maturation permease subunit